MESVLQEINQKLGVMPMKYDKCMKNQCKSCKLYKKCFKQQKEKKKEGDINGKKGKKNKIQ